MLLFSIDLSSISFIEIETILYTYSSMHFISKLK